MKMAESVSLKEYPSTLHNLNLYVIFLLTWVNSQDPNYLFPFCTESRFTRNYSRNILSI